MRRLFLLFLSVFVLAPHVQAEIQLDWPLAHEEGETPVISSAFGPRKQMSEGGRYDFHRGLDLPAEIGTDVFAAASGAVHRVYFEANSSYDSPTVILKHYNGEQKYYTWYSHLSWVNPDLERGAEVLQGEKIAEVGDEGASYSHLHFELRVGSPCSLKAQISGFCTYHGFDPHRDPLQYILDRPSKPVRLRWVASDNDILDFRVISSAEDLDVHRYELETLEGETLVLDFNERIGVDASTDEGIDSSRLDLNGDTEVDVIVQPFHFNASSDWRVVRLRYLNRTDFAEFRVYDVWGNETVLVAKD